MNRPGHEAATTAELRAAAPMGADVAAIGMPSHPEAVAVAPAELYPIIAKSEAPPLPWSVRLAGVALAALAVFLLWIALS